MISFTQGTIDTTGSKISSEDAQAVLDHHNKARSDLGIPPLTNFFRNLEAPPKQRFGKLMNTCVKEIK